MADLKNNDEYEQQINLKELLNESLLLNNQKQINLKELLNESLLLNNQKQVNLTDLLD